MTRDLNQADAGTATTNGAPRASATASPSSALQDAYADAERAIRSLHCEECRQIQWPVIAEPARGSTQWWDEPGAYFACRNCGRYLASAFAYPVIRSATRDFPFLGMVGQKDRESGP